MVGIGMIVGFGSHLILDQIGYPYDSLHFFLLYRIFVEKKKVIELRDAVFRRDGFKCRNCKATNNLQIHEKNLHGLPFQKNPWAIDEWITVCEKCHIQRHGGSALI
jgi:hypothetical protein